MPGERLSTWCRRNGIVAKVEGPDPDFGRLIVSPELARHEHDLRIAALPPRVEPIPPGSRTMYCPECWTQDFSEGRPAYWRASWITAWRTSCPEHGGLYDPGNSRVPRLREILFTRSDPTGPVGIRESHSNWSKHAASYFGFNIFSDRRAIHLEAALDCSLSGGWAPAGYDWASFYPLYWDIVGSLCRQFGQPPMNGVPHRFLTMLGSYRYMVSVCAEAVISVWTNTPLPSDACSELRTQAIARALGWAPPARRDVRRCWILSRPEGRDVTRCTKYLGASDRQRLCGEEWRDWSRLGRLPQHTSSEATSIGLSEERIHARIHPHLREQLESIFSLGVPPGSMSAMKACRKRGVPFKVRPK